MTASANTFVVEKMMLVLQWQVGANGSLRPVGSSKTENILTEFIS